MQGMGSMGGGMKVGTLKKPKKFKIKKQRSIGSVAKSLAGFQSKGRMSMGGM